MKGIFVFWRSGNAFDEFPLEVTECWMGTPKAKGRLFFKGKETEKQERERIDKTYSYTMGDGSTGGLSDFLYVPYVFLENGSDWTRELPPLVMQAEYQGEAVFLFANRGAFGTARREGSEQEVPIHAIPFSSEETEAEYGKRMKGASDREQMEICQWPIVYL